MKGKEHGEIFRIEWELAAHELRRVSRNPVWPHAGIDIAGVADGDLAFPNPPLAAADFYTRSGRARYYLVRTSAGWRF